MSPGSLYQLAPSAKKRDAVGRMVLALDALLRRNRIRSLVFTERQQSPGLGGVYLGRVRRGLLKDEPFWNGGQAPRFSLYHHSIGTLAAERFLRWPAEKRIVIYHNITPAELATSEAEAQDRVWGREQLKTLCAQSDLMVGLSDFSCRELSAAGARRVLQLPYLHSRPGDGPSPSKRKDPTVLVVGRVEPHKRVAEAIQAFYPFAQKFPRARLMVIGSLTGNRDYAARLRALIKTLNLEKQVQLAGKISDRRLGRLYRESHALLTLSSHEGFCVPILDALKFRLPVVAYPAGAIAETVGMGGLIVDSVDPQTVSDALVSVLNDTKVADRIRIDQERQYAGLAPERFEAKFMEALREL